MITPVNSHCTSAWATQPDLASEKKKNQLIHVWLSKSYYISHEFSQLQSSNMHKSISSVLCKLCLTFAYLKVVSFLFFFLFFFFFFFFFVFFFFFFFFSFPSFYFFFFFQAEDGIRDDLVTGVQTCALPILELPNASKQSRSADHETAL